MIEQRENATRFIRSIDSNATPGVEIRCEVGGHRYALEHTRLDPYPDRRADDQRFLTVLSEVPSSVEQSGALRADRAYRLAVDVHAFRDFKRAEFADVREHLTTWIIGSIRGLIPSGRSRGAVCKGAVPGGTAKVQLTVYESDGPRGGQLELVRLEPNDLEELRRQRVGAAIKKKGAKLHAEHAVGSTAVLVLENNDIAISNHIVIADALHAELDASFWRIDEVFLVETDVDGLWQVWQLRERDGARWPTEDRSPPRWEFVPSTLNDITGPAAAIDERTRTPRAS